MTKLRGIFKMMRKRKYAVLGIIIVLSLSCNNRPWYAEDTLYQIVPDKNYITEIEPVLDDGSIQVVIEMPAGTRAKWEVSESGDLMEWTFKNGRPRVIDYLACPFNFGMLPGSIQPLEMGGDNDPLDAHPMDVLVLGESIERGTVIQAKVLGVIRMQDQGKRDDKIIAAPVGSHMAKLTGLNELAENYPGILAICEIWLLNYKRNQKIEIEKIENETNAWNLIINSVTKTAYQKP